MKKDNGKKYIYKDRLAMFLMLIGLLLIYKIMEKE